MSAVFPSADSATLSPNEPGPLSSLAVSFGPCWINGSIRSGYRAPRSFTLSRSREPDSDSHAGSRRPRASRATSPP